MIERNISIGSLLALGYYGIHYNKTGNSPGSKPIIFITSMYCNLYVEGTTLYITELRTLKTGSFVRFSWTTRPSDFDKTMDYSPAICPPETLIDTVIMDEANKVSYYTKNYDKIYVAQNDGFWYGSGDGKIIDKSNLLDTYTSTNKDAYSEGMYSNYYLQFDSETVEYSKGSTHYGEVVSTNGGQYPRDGEQDGYWYVLQVNSIYHWRKYTPGTSKKYNWNKYSIVPNSEIGDTITFQSYYERYYFINITFDTLFDAQYGNSSSQTITLTPDTNNIFTLYTIPMDGTGTFSTKTVDLFNACKGLFDKIWPITAHYVGKNGEEIPLPIFDFGKCNNIVALKRDNELWFANEDTDIHPGLNATKDALDYDKIQISFLQPASSYLTNYNKLPIPVSWKISHSNTNPTETTRTNILRYRFVLPKEIGGVQERTWTKPYTGGDSIGDEIDLIRCLNTNANGTTFDTDYLSVIHKSTYHYYDNITFDLAPGPGKYIGAVSSTDKNAYPENGADEESGYYYKYVGEEDVFAGEFIEEVESRNINDYPQDGEQDGFYYIYAYTTDDTLIKGDLIEQVENTDKNAYPNDKVVDDYWYVYSHSEIHYFCGMKIGKENSFDKNDYPIDGKQGDYWYYYIGYENKGPYKNYFIDQVETNQPTSYPLDGINGNYWYVYNKSYTGYKAQIFDNQIIGGINYQHNINPQSDATIGNVGMAKVDFTYDNTNDDFQRYIDLDYFLYYTWQNNDSDWRLIGKFFIDDVSYNRTRAKITAYDSICKTEAFVDDFIEQTTFPITLQAFYNNLLTYLGLENGGFKSLNMSDFSNLKQQIKDNFQAINITGRQILQYIAEMAGGYCLADKNGKIIIGDYSGKNTYPLNSSKYKKYEASKFEPERVRYVCAKMNTDDLGVAVGEADLGEEYIIENNPLFYTENEDEIKPALTNLMNLLYRYTGGYKPGTIELLEDFGIEVGDRVVIGNNYFYVMSKTMSASGCKLECFGNKHREKQAQSINSEIVALRGKTNELVRDLEKTQSTLTDTANGLQSQITQTASQIRSEVKNNYDGLSSSITQTASSIRSEVNDTKNELSSAIEQTASSITATVSDNKQELESKIEQTASSISSTVSQQGQVISQIKQDLDGISLTYNSEQGTASITIGDITISELVDGKYVDRVVAGIDFSGYCRFSDLSTPGQTIICGDNITTGTISADRIELTGSISWGDLSDSCQDTIASFAGSGGSGGEVPSYIKSTYIDATTIKSPTIYGAKIYAGTSAEGYIKLASTGMNFYSNSGGSVCGIGYYPGKYNLPYIMLGQGVDDAGTDKGMIKKYTNGIWIGDSDNVSSNSPGGTGIFINFTSGKIQKYINGSVSTL